MRRIAAIGVLMFGGCTCLTPVEECGALCDGGTAGGSAGGAAGGAAGGTAGGAAGGSAGGSGTAGGAGGGAAMPRLDAGCALWDGGGVGTCGALTGFVFLGSHCEGACVQYPIQTPGVFPNLASCAQTCAAAGFCNEAKWLGRPAPPPPLAPGSFCDEVVAQLPAGSSIAPLEEAVGGINNACVSSSTGTDCQIWMDELGDAGHLRSCAATLVQSVESVTCRIFL